MKKQLASALFLLLSNCLFGQNKQNNNELTFSLPFVWNKTEIYNSYSGARAKSISDDAISYGSNINYSRSVYKAFFVTVGIGYYKQAFGIQRPFDYDDQTTNLLYWTDNYYYQCLQYIAGIGYKQVLSDKYDLKGTITYNHFTTFRQVFDPQYTSSAAEGKDQIENKNYSFGKSIIVSGGINREIVKRLSAGIEILFPVYNRWRKDVIFREDASEFYGSKIVIGTGIKVSYKF